MIGELETRVLAHGIEIGCRNSLDHVEPARPQIGEPYGGVRDRQIDDAVEVDLVLVPIIGKALEDDAILGDAFDKFERAGAYRV
jgi:hypothetical protein